MQRLAHWLYTNNPFYVVSAALMFVGLRMSFDTGAGEHYQTGALMAGLMAYTLLLAATAWFLIRYGELWQDVRSLLVVVVLLFLATSVCIDRSLADDVDTMRVPLAIGGFVFAVVVSELLLRGIGLRLPAGFRLPYYAVLALFFLYPAAIIFFSFSARNAALKWVLYGFSPLAGVVFLGLLPAVRRGPDYVADNGSPWRWPWYPWVLFGALAFGLCLRTYSLSVSFHAVGRSAHGLRPVLPGPVSVGRDVCVARTGHRLGQPAGDRLGAAGADCPDGDVAYGLAGRGPRRGISPSVSRFAGIFTAVLGRRVGDAVLRYRLGARRARGYVRILPGRRRVFDLRPIHI